MSSEVWNELSELRSSEARLEFAVFTSSDMERKSRSRSAVALGLWGLKEGGKRRERGVRGRGEGRTKESFGAGMWRRVGSV
jgi:hypothetical protein